MNAHLSDESSAFHEDNAIRQEVFPGSEIQVDQVAHGEIRTSTVKENRLYQALRYDSSRDGRPLSRGDVNRCRVQSDGVAQGVFISMVDDLRATKDHLQRSGDELWPSLLGPALAGRHYVD
jgi:hypothetical protein